MIVTKIRILVPTVNNSPSKKFRQKFVYFILFYSYLFIVSMLLLFFFFFINQMCIWIIRSLLHPPRISPNVVHFLLGSVRSSCSVYARRYCCGLSEKLRCVKEEKPRWTVIYQSAFHFNSQTCKSWQSALSIYSPLHHEGKLFRSLA